jgi:hypothetical protein
VPFLIMEEQSKTHHTDPDFQWDFLQRDIVGTRLSCWIPRSASAFAPRCKVSKHLFKPAGTFLWETCPYEAHRATLLTSQLPEVRQRRST